MLMLNLLKMYVLFSCLIVNDVISDKNAVTKIMSKSTGLQHIGFNGFSKRHWQTDYHPFSFSLFSFGPASNVPKLTHYGVV